MNNKTLATTVASALLGGILGATLIDPTNFGATLTTDTATITALEAEITTVEATKHSILKDNVWKDVRLGEAPEWDISVVSSQEMTDAYVSLADELNAKTDPNLYTALREKSDALGVSCQK